MVLLSKLTFVALVLLMVALHQSSGSERNLKGSAVDRLPSESSPLGKFVLTFSKPGAFGKGTSVFGEESGPVTTCPPGDEGLACRRREALRGADECSGGDCETCRYCDAMPATQWTQCCKNNFRCCSELAAACQKCDHPELHAFCAKNFKRCF